MVIFRLSVAILVGMMAFNSTTVLGQDYPNKPIRIVTTTAGGGSDFVARIIAGGIAGPLGQQVIVDNRASTQIAAEIVAKSPPDGYTLYVGAGALWILPLLQKVPYDMADFAPLALIERSFNIFAVHPSVAATSVAELIALAKAKPGQLNYASAGVTGNSHLATELFKSMTGVNLVHVPYKGPAPAITALVSGEVQILINDAGLLAPHAKAGQVRALAVTSEKPSVLFPGLPTVSVAVPGYSSGGMTGIHAPAKTPAPIMTKLNQEIVRLLNRQDIKEKFLNNGSETVGNSPEEFAALVKADVARMSKTIKDAGIKVD